MNTAIKLSAVQIRTLKQAIRQDGCIQEGVSLTTKKILVGAGLAEKDETFPGRLAKRYWITEAGRKAVEQ